MSNTSILKFIHKNFGNGYIVDPTDFFLAIKNSYLNDSNIKEKNLKNRLNLYPKLFHTKFYKPFIINGKIDLKKLLALYPDGSMLDVIKERINVVDAWSNKILCKFVDIGFRQNKELAANEIGSDHHYDLSKIFIDLTAEVFDRPKNHVMLSNVVSWVLSNDKTEFDNNILLLGHQGQGKTTCVKFIMQVYRGKYLTQNQPQIYKDIFAKLDKLKKSDEQDQLLNRGIKRLRITGNDQSEKHEKYEKSDKQNGAQVMKHLRSIQNQKLKQFDTDFSIEKSMLSEGGYCYRLCLSISIFYTIT
jgi:hypothetical protein